MDIQSVKSAFDRFEAVWNFDDFWTRANTFDACITCYNAAAKQWPGDPNLVPMRAVLDQLCVSNVPYYDANRAGKFQADHFGWWGLASLNAYRYLLSTNNDLAKAYGAIASNAWKQMISRGYDTGPKTQPVAGGCANSANKGEHGTKTTTANLNLLLLSIRLAQVMGNKDPEFPTYLSIAYAQYVWFRTWFTNTFDDFEYLRAARNLTLTCSLILERPIAAPDYKMEEHPPWQRLCAWSADQGMLLASLLGLLQIESDLRAWGSNQNPKIDLPSTYESEITDWFAKLAGGVSVLSFCSAGNCEGGGVLREPPFAAMMVEQFGHVKDYVGGRGVLLRYLGGMKGQLSQYYFDRTVPATASLALATCTSDHQFQANWTNDAPSYYECNRQVGNKWGAPMPWQVQWPYDSSITDPVVLGVLQGQGLDALGAAIMFM